MILVSKPSKPFTYTAKFTARRGPVLKDYQTKIDELYAEVDQTTQQELIPPPSWDISNSLDFIQTVVLTVLKRSIGDDEDLFQNGCDSLQVTWIRNTLLNALRKSSKIDTRSIPMNFVYENHSISMLASFLSQLFHIRRATSDISLIGQRVNEMHALVEKYSDFGQPSPSSTASSPSPSKAVVLLTGSTGGLGSALLAKLISSAAVSRVFALNTRRGDSNLIFRHKAVFLSRGLDEGFLSSSKLILLEGELSLKDLGLEGSTYTKMRQSVTHIIHNGYTVNFNHPLSTFEGNIAGLRHLIDLALSTAFTSPPRLLFTSSISVVRDYNSDIVGEVEVEAKAAIGSGYSESKWVCEQLLNSAARKTALRPITIRVGQLAGMSTNGFWNSKEWLYALLKSSISLGVLPALDKSISWIPVDIAADVVLEMLNTSEQILHLANPHPVSWSSIFVPIAVRLNLRVVPYSEWLAALHAIDTNAHDDDVKKAVELERTYPALRLREFFNSVSSSTPSGESLGSDKNTSIEEEALGLKRLSLQKAVQVSPTLAKCPPLSSSDAMLWLESWKLVG